MVITQNGSSLEQEAQFRCIHLLEGTDLLLAALGLAGNPEVKSPLPTLVMLLELTDKYILSVLNECFVSVAGNCALLT